MYTIYFDVIISSINLRFILADRLIRQRVNPKKKRRGSVDLESPFVSFVRLLLVSTVRIAAVVRTRSSITPALHHLCERHFRSRGERLDDQAVGVQFHGSFSSRGIDLHVDYVAEFVSHRHVEEQRGNVAFPVHRIVPPVVGREAVFTGQSGM